MRVLTEPLKELECFKRAEATFRNKGTSALISGCADSQKINLAWGLSEPFHDRIIVTYSDARVREIYEDLKIYDKNVHVFPAKDVIFYEADVHSNRLTKDRLTTIKRVMKGLGSTIVTTFSGLMNAGADISLLKKNIINLSIGSSVDESELARKLVSMGYEKSYQVETGGQFSVRGGIVDIFDLTEENPYRIELWGDEVTSLRSFDVESQRSVENLKTVDIFPANELPLSQGELFDGLRRIERDKEKLVTKFEKNTNPEAAHRLKVAFDEIDETIREFPWSFNADGYIRYFVEEPRSFADYFEDAIFVIDEPSRTFEHADAVELEFKESMKARLEKGYIVPGQADILFAKNAVLAILKKQNILLLSTMENRVRGFEPSESAMVNAHSIPTYGNDFTALIKDLKSFKKRGYRTLLLSASRTRAERLAKNIEEYEVSAFFSDDRERVLCTGEIATMYGNVVKGFEYPEIKFVVIPESDIFTEEKKKRRKKQYEGSKVNNLNDLHVADYVVHERYGVGIYKGIETMTVSGVSKDYMKIDYREGGVLYVPATGLNTIMKYSSADGRKPKINKLGTQEWAKTTSKVREAVDVIANELVELYAKRSSREGHRFPEDTPWQTEFEELFPYEETSDQLDAIEATKADMESSKIMDRLICGDVGYGKTEIAIRAAFKAVQDSKQVALLVPTTILAEQHYNTFVQRMKDFPVKIELLSRFVPKSKQNAIIKAVKEGTVDIVIGTHRLLSSDISFKDLGLLIVDEEQRFGVTHKEKIKQIKEDVDVLTLTATPIPRTLHMSLVGIRDMSILEEPPSDRLPIQTYVLEYNEEMVREAITRELSRNGQVYYVYNRVNSIADAAAAVQKLVPEATVAFAHGQMKESELERIMYDFIRGDIDVLVATTIIETGIDIPNVNTMIIHDSDSLGLSQLYQLRGRVGRSGRTAYAFLMYKRDKSLKEIAEKRLQTIRDFTDLGSGYKIAMKDLEIRGAGNILGKSQSGHMEAVGYDMYCKLLNKAVQKQKGIEEKEEFSTSIDLDVDAFIPPDYILNELQKLDTYKRIAGLSNHDDVKEMADELKDRFGKLPESAVNLLKIADLKIVANSLYISDIKGKFGEVSFAFKPDAKINVANIDTLLKAHKGHLKLENYGIPTFIYTYAPTGEVISDENRLMENSKMVLEDMDRYLSFGK